MFFTIAIVGGYLVDWLIYYNQEIVWEVKCVYIPSMRMSYLS